MYNKNSIFKCKCGEHFTVESLECESCISTDFDEKNFSFSLPCVIRINCEICKKPYAIHLINCENCINPKLGFYEKV